jgi:hypothetical protein
MGNDRPWRHRLHTARPPCSRPVARRGPLNSKDLKEPQSRNRHARDACRCARRPGRGRNRALVARRHDHHAHAHICALARVERGHFADIASLPPGARVPVSALLGSRVPAYRITGLRARDPSERLLETFAPEGPTITLGGAHVAFRLTSYGRGRSLVRVTPAPPRASANRVDYRHRGIDEWYLNGRARRSWLTLRGTNLTIHVDDHGARYPLRIDPFIQQAEMSLADGAANDQFAVAAISGDTLVVGAPGRSVDGHAGQGAVFVFVKPASGWAQAAPTAELTASDGAGEDGLGAAVAISGDAIVAGAASHAVGNTPFAGAAYVFVKPASGWTNATQTAELTASDGADGDGFGEAVGVSGDTIVVGPVQHDIGKNSRQGEAYAFVKPATGWANSRQPS